MINGLSGDTLNILVLITQFLPMALAASILVVAFVFEAIGLYEILKRRGYKNPWLTYIPIAQSYLLGSTADSINRSRGKKSNHWIWLTITKGLATFIFAAIFVWALLNVFIVILVGEAVDWNGFFIAFLQMFPFIYLLSAVAYVFECVCHYKIFSEYSYSNATILILLSVFLAIAPFILFVIRKNPPGMQR